MALLPVHDFFVFNDSVEPVRNFTPSENEGGIYEVLRVVEGVPLFLEDHMERFYSSAEIAGKSVRFTKTQIEIFLNKLIEINNVKDGNILISCKTNLKAFFISHNYPTTEMYANGVTCGILNAEREKPNAKVFQTSVRQQANKLIEENELYEVLLIDSQGRIKEGSKTNVFFVKGDSVITPPGNEVLLGITRKKAIELASSNGIKCVEDDVFFKNADLFDAAFLTGTSPKIIPVRKFDGIKYDPAHFIVSKLMSSYNSLILEYTKNKRNI